MESYFRNYLLNAFYRAGVELLGSRNIWSNSSLFISSFTLLFFIFFTEKYMKIIIKDNSSYVKTKAYSFLLLVSLPMAAIILWLSDATDIATSVKLNSRDVFMYFFWLRISLNRGEPLAPFVHIFRLECKTNKIINICQVSAGIQLSNERNQ